MDEIDRKIADYLQKKGKVASAELADLFGIAVSTANDRVRRLASSGVIRTWRAILDPEKVAADLCVFILLDLTYDGEADACNHLVSCEEVMELHHISGPHSYLMKVRVQNTRALQDFLTSQVKPLPGVAKTETLISLDALKETSMLKIGATQQKT